MNVARPVAPIVAPIVARLPIVVLALLVALGTALGLGAGRADAASGEQVWGFVDMPSAVDAGWRGPLTVSWRNFSGEDQTYRVLLRGPGLDWEGEVAAPAEEQAFRRGVAVPALTTEGEYRAQLFLAGSDEELSAATVRVGSPHIVEVRAGARSIVPTGSAAQRRSVTSFGVDSPATVSGRIADAAGRTVLHRSFGTHVAGETMRWGWAGKDTAGRVVDAGRYTMHLVAHSGDVASSTTLPLRVVR